jgi:hypothetical protein
LKKSKAYLKAKVDEYDAKEADFEAQMKKYVDLVKHLELERNQVGIDLLIHIKNLINKLNKLILNKGD